jgi:DNA primase
MEPKVQVGHNIRQRRDALVIGLIGRSTVDGDRRTAAKYLNPARTVVYDKSEALYDPTSGELDVDGQVVIVEGVMDALVIATAAQAAGVGDKFRPVSTSGLTFSDSSIGSLRCTPARR